MVIDDSAFPAPTLIAYSTVAVGDFVRHNGDYLQKPVGGGPAFNLSTATPTPISDTELVQPVGATLVITAP